MDYRDKPPSNETGSSFNRRNPAKWVRIRPALTLPLSGAVSCGVEPILPQVGSASDGYSEEDFYDLVGPTGPGTDPLLIAYVSREVVTSG